MISPCRVRGCLTVLQSLLWVWVAGAGTEPDRVLPLWPGMPPGESQARGEEHRVEGRPRPFYQLTDITTPSLSVFLPPADSRNGTAVLVCPGGGLQRLAWEHEGLEVARWLNSNGVVAAVLKYRVPAPARTAAMDVQRAMSLIRSRAGEWRVDPDSIGFLGFSAGGELGVWLLTHSDERLYPEVDAADAVPCRPNFVALAYSGGLLQRDGTLKEPLGSRIRPGLPPVFLTHAFDDSSQESLALALALKRAGVPTEVHVFREGGHGFGVRNTGIPTGTWKDRYLEWMGSLGYLDRPALREQTRRVAAAWESGRTPPRVTELIPDATLADAYAVQHRWVRWHAAMDPVAGFKAAAATAKAQTALGIDGPLAGVVFRSGWLDGAKHPVIPLRDREPIVVETEVGYLTSVDLSYEILNDEQVHGAVSALVPIIELPRSYPDGGAPDARNTVAGNAGSQRYIVGAPVAVGTVEPDAVAVVLRRDGQVLNETSGSAVAGGQWHNLRRVLNAITRQGYTIPAGSVILGGALGRVPPGEKGRYQASYGSLGSIEFELR
ncbi:MAG: hypothetical protein U1G08_00140 [Verrucomicrobiota bacterium]